MEIKVLGQIVKFLVQPIRVCLKVLVQEIEVMDPRTKVLQGLHFKAVIRALDRTTFVLRIIRALVLISLEVLRGPSHGVMVWMATTEEVGTKVHLVLMDQERTIRKA
jgi:hypothetical protein